MLKLTLEAETLGGLVHEMRQLLAQVDAGTSDMAILGMDEKATADSPDAFVPDFKDDFDPHLNEKMDDPVDDLGTDEPKKPRKRKLTPKKETNDAAHSTHEVEAGGSASSAKKGDSSSKLRQSKAKKESSKAKAPAKNSRRKGNGATSPAKAAIAVGKNTGLEISDRDVGKAASAAAQVLTVKVVQEIKGEYGVSNVQELDQDQRREFIDQLNGLLEEANG